MAVGEAPADWAGLWESTGDRLGIGVGYACVFVFGSIVAVTSYWCYWMVAVAEEGLLLWPEFWASTIYYWICICCWVCYEDCCLACFFVYILTLAFSFACYAVSKCVFNLSLHGRGGRKEVLYLCSTTL